MQPSMRPAACFQRSIAVHVQLQSATQLTCVGELIDSHIGEVVTQPSSAAVLQLIQAGQGMREGLLTDIEPTKGPLKGFKFSPKGFKFSPCLKTKKAELALPMSGVTATCRLSCWVLAYP